MFSRETLLPLLRSTVDSYFAYAFGLYALLRDILGSSVEFIEFDLRSIVDYRSPHQVRSFYDPPIQHRANVIQHSMVSCRAIEVQHYVLLYELLGDGAFYIESGWRLVTRVVGKFSVGEVSVPVVIARDA